MSEKEEFDRILREVNEKLEKNPELKKEMKKHVEAIEEIFGYPVEVNLVYLKGVSDYMEVFDEYDDDDLNVSNAMSMSEFKKFISEEDDDLKVAIDPIHLNKGVNEITNVLITSYEDKAIIVPITRKEDE